MGEPGCNELTSENVNLDLGGRGVVGDAAVDAGVGGVGVLHQKVDARPLRFLGDDLTVAIMTIDFPKLSEMSSLFTETPFRGPLKDISALPCSHLTVSGGLSVLATTQLMLIMLPTSTNRSGPPMMYEEGSETRGTVSLRMNTDTVLAVAFTNQ